MELIGLTTQNFKKLRDFKASFTAGLNVITGENFQGKSTLLQAIAVALYGISTCPSKKEDIPTWGQKNFKVELTFSHDGRQFTATRDKANAKIEEHGTEKLAASGHTACTKFVEELLGLNYKDFTLFVLSAQHETAGVLTFGATALQRRVEEFSGASVIDTVLSKVRTGASRLSGSLETLERVDTDILETQFDAADQGVNAFEAEVQAFTQAVTDQQDEFNGLTTQINKLQAQQQAHADAGVARATVTVKLEGLTQQIAELEATDLDLQDLTEMRSELVTRNEELKSMKSDASAHQLGSSKLVSARASLETLTPQLDAEVEYSAAKADLEAKVTKATADVVPAAEAARDLSKELGVAKIAEKDGTCQACERPFEDHNPAQLALITSNLKVALAKASGTLEGLQLAESTAKKELRLLKAVPTGIQQQIDKLTPQVAALESELAAMSVPGADRITNLETAISELKAKGMAGKTHNEAVTTRVEKLEQLNGRLVNNEAKLAELPDTQPVDAAVLSEATMRAAEVAKLLGKDREDLNDLKISLNSANSDKRTAQSALESAVATNEKVAAFAGDLDRHKRLNKYLSDTRTAYLSQVWDQILNLASAKCLLSTDGVITKLGRTQAGEFEFVEAGKTTPIAGSSGAQKGHIGVAVRIGLSSALYGQSGLLILDEPTESMSEKQSQQLAGALMGLSGQCLFITHKPLEQMVAQNVIRVGE